jgi:hypothetical protein
MVDCIGKLHVLKANALMACIHSGAKLHRSYLDHVITP